MSEPADIPMVTMFMGKNVDDMTREEAIAALKVASKGWHDQIETTLSVNRTWAALLCGREFGG